ncbi:MAG: tRNA (N(6)-L-threonylcarbamoyladenosine(37)-C(2))-methylthiotransferase MtaB [Bdellovibrionales bacterium]
MSDSAFFEFQVETYGCKVNHYDTGLLQKRMVSEGHQFTSEKARVHVINSCAVTEEATKEALRRVRKIKSDDPNKIVVVTGCAAQVDTDRFALDSQADLVIANSHKGQLESLVQQYIDGKLSERVFKSNIFKKEDLEAGGGQDLDHTRSFLKIQDGCNSFCTFCVIPFARGKSRSVPIDELVQRVNDLYSEGVREVVLTGVHIGDYEDDFFGNDHLRGLEDLIEQLLVRTSMPRFRVSSLEPIELSDRLLELFQEEAMCPHFHMSIQSANTKVLSDMKRKYTAEQVEYALNWIQQKVPGAYVGMDVIVGFPGETEEEFTDTYSRLNASPWTRIHVFPYSERPGTYANRLPDKWDRSLIMARSRRLRELSSNRYLDEAKKQIGSIKQTMKIASKSTNTTRCLSKDYWNIVVPESSSYSLGEEFQVKLTGIDDSQHSKMDGCLIGQFVK